MVDIDQKNLKRLKSKVSFVKRSYFTSFQMERGPGDKGSVIK